jgi:protein TonB
MVIHAGIFLQISGRFDFKKTSYIKISLQQNTVAPARNIPSPKLRQAHKIPDPPVLTNTPTETVTPEKLYLPEPTEILNNDMESFDETLTEEIPQQVALEVAAFSLSEIEESGGFGTRMDYLDMVRIKIENNKQYPEVARQRKLEGQVYVKFSILSDGRISGLQIVTSSGFDALDEAAIQAVKDASPFSSPPEKYFEKGVIEIKVPIVFEILR